MYCESGHYGKNLAKLPEHVKNNAIILETEGEFVLDQLTITATMENIQTPLRARDILTLVRKAKMGFLKKELNVHEIGPYGYRHRTIIRGKDISSKEFDAIKRVGDGDLYITSLYKEGKESGNIVSRDVWYVFYDTITLAGRKMQERTKMQIFYDGICEMLLEEYLKSTRLQKAAS